MARVSISNTFRFLCKNQWGKEKNSLGKASIGAGVLVCVGGRGTELNKHLVTRMSSGL